MSLFCGILFVHLFIFISLYFIDAFSRSPLFCRILSLHFFVNVLNFACFKERSGLFSFLSLSSF